MLTKERVRTIHEDIQAALQQVASKHGLTISQRSKVSYTDTTFKFSVDFADADAANGAEIVDPKFIRNAERFGLSHLLGKSFNDTRAGDVTFIGMTSRDISIVQAKDGKMYRFRTNVVTMMLSGK